MAAVRLSGSFDGYRTRVLGRGRSLVCRAGIRTLSSQASMLFGRSDAVQGRC
jgi:hypothetical protein